MTPSCFCFSQGYPIPDKVRKEAAAARAKDVLRSNDAARAYEKVPRGHYKGRIQTHSCSGKKDE